MNNVCTDIQMCSRAIHACWCLYAVCFPFSLIKFSLWSCKFYHIIEILCNKVQLKMWPKFINCLVIYCIIDIPTIPKHEIDRYYLVSRYQAYSIDSIAQLYCIHSYIALHIELYVIIFSQFFNKMLIAMIVEITIIFWMKFGAKLTQAYS